LVVGSGVGGCGVDGGCREKAADEMEA